MRKNAWWLCALLFFASDGFAATFYTYSIGNSLTLNSNLQAVDDMAANQGITATSDQHILTGTGLDTIWSNPTATFNTPSFGPFPTAFTNQVWNAVTLEPFDGVLEGTSGDANRIVDFMNYAAAIPGITPPQPNPINAPLPASDVGNPGNINTQFYIFVRWSEQDTWSPDYDGGWKQSYAGPNGPTNPSSGPITVQTADYYNQLLAAVRQAQPQNMKPVELIPTGFVFDSIANALKNGQLQEIGSMQNLYVDSTHLNELGSFVASTTFYATIFHEDPVGMVLPSEYSNLDPTTANDLENIVWNVVSTLPTTGVAVPEPGFIIFPAMLFILALRRQSLRC